MNVYIRLVYRNLRANLDKGTLFFTLIFPLFFIFIQGFALGGIIPSFEIGDGKNISYPLFLAAGAVTLTVINSGTNAGIQLWFDRKNGMFEQILMGPFNRAQYILSMILATLIIGIAGSLLVFLFALPVLGEALSITLPGVVLIVLALTFGTLFFGGMGIALSVALKSSESFQVVSTFIFFVFLFTSSVFFPVERAPTAIQVVGLFNPLTYTTDMFRSGIFDVAIPSIQFKVTALIVEALAMFALAVLAFRRIRV
jgi:ABC-2 type transport system permease protein